MDGCSQSGVAAVAVQRVSERLFPRLTSRGPIEAVSAIAYSMQWPRFPRLTSRGPIEAAVGEKRPSADQIISATNESRPH